jgi:hypothetical protein
VLPVNDNAAVAERVRLRLAPTAKLQIGGLMPMTPVLFT